MFQAKDLVLRRVLEKKVDLMAGKFKPNWEGSYMIVKVGAACDAPFPTRPAWADQNRVRDATKITQNHILAEAIIKLGKPIII